MEKNHHKDKNPLRIVSHDQSFHFYTSVEHYCGVSSNSLEEFANALQYVCSEAIIFHFERGDFQNWIRDIIGDVELAQRIDEIKMCARQLSEECCRKELVEAVNIRILQLETKVISPLFGGRKRK
jgi:hypothetical protein